MTKLTTVPTVAPTAEAPEDAVEPPGEPTRPPIVDAPRSVRTTLAETWHARHLLGWLATRLLVKQYARTYVGRLWLVIKPIVDTFGKALVFGGVFGATAPEGVPYLLFVIVGMQCWIVFEQTVTWATRSYDRYRKIFRDIDIPLLLIPISVIADPLLQFLSYTGIFLVMLLAYYFIDGQVYLLLEPQLLLAPVALALTMVFALGLGIWLGIGNAQTRDVRWGVRYVLQIWMFLTPVLYPLRDLPGIFPTLAQLNPMTPLVEMFKFAVLGTGYVDARTLAYSVGVAVITLLSGVWVLSRLTPWLQLRAHRTLGGEDELTGEDEDDAVSATEERRPPR